MISNRDDGADLSCVWALNAWQNCMMLTPVLTKSAGQPEERVSSACGNLQLNEASCLLFSHL